MKQKIMNTKKIALIVIGILMAGLLLIGTANAAGYADDVCAEEGEIVNRNPFMGSVDRQCCVGLVENRVSKSYGVCEKPARGTIIRLGAQEAPETTIIKNEIEMSKVIIMLVDGDAFENRKTMSAPIYILGCKTRDLGIINSVAAEMPTSLLEGGFLNSPKIWKIVPDIRIRLPRPPSPKIVCPL
jgi:hypothetical protein